MSSPSPPAAAKGRMLFLDYLRAGAVVLVVWSHMAGLWLTAQHRVWLPYHLTDRFLAAPLGITQDFGWLGVVLFFLMSGFVISHVAAHESRLQFAVKRISRIYVPLAVGVGIAVAVIALRNHYAVPDTLSGGALDPVPPASSILLSISLANYYVLPQRLVLGVTWTLAIEVIFYLLVFALKSLIRLRGGLLSWAILLVVLVVIESSKQFGNNWFLIAASTSYVPLLVLGQALWLRWTRRIGWSMFLAITLAAWALFVHGLELLQPVFLDASPQAYGPSVAIAYAIFVIALIGAGHLRKNMVVDYLASRSYSIYLIHGTVGIFILDLSRNRLLYPAALLCALLGTALVAEAVYRCFEVTSQRLARRLVQRRSTGVAQPVRELVNPML